MVYDVVVVGAGPVGLSLALALARARRSVLVLEKESSTSEHSRAPGIWPRTQEILAQLGVIDQFLHDGIVRSNLELWDAQQERVLLRLPLLELAGQTKYPHLLILPQSRTERLLYEAVTKEPSASVMFSAEATELVQQQATVRLTYRCRGRLQTVESAFVAGCDGAHSTVRDGLGAYLEGHTYPVKAALADVMLENDREYRFPRLSTRTNLALAIRMNRQVWRLILPSLPGRELGSLDFRVQQAVTDLFPAQAYRTVWTSEFHLHRRVSTRLVAGRVALAGDAAHLNSPVGGQGMNAGIQDTEVLTAALLEGLESGDAAPLQDYARRRRAVVSRRVNRFTDRMTRAFLFRGGRFVKPMLHVVNLIMHVSALRGRLLRRLAMLDQ